ncbi:MAG: PQQ-binding-like beta-propeller repeat protein [candidate division WOR-3 bacterium]|nr:MAG: PQQ-binding-like beta-propeller repeat protein [candidate division WOR-3 bacterium]
MKPTVENCATRRFPLSAAILLVVLTGAGSASWPIGVPASIERYPNGNTMICDAGGLQAPRARIIEVDSLGRLVWAYLKADIPWAHTARLLDNGNVLITATEADRVVEVDRDGNRVWEFRDSLDYPNEAFRLESGNTLITDRDNDRVIEVDPFGRIVWRYTALVRPHHGKYLGNGNLLVCDSERDRVLEVNPEGGVVWSYGTGLNWPRSSLRLGNGNTLIGDSRNRRVLEVTSGGGVVWQWSQVVGLPYMAVRLENDNTLVSTGPDVLEISPDRRVVWRYPNTVEVLAETLRIYNPSSDCSLYVHVHRPAYASPDNPLPAVILVPGLTNPGTVFDQNRFADNIASDGFVVMHFDPEGRGRTGAFPEDYGGHVHQDGLRSCLEAVAARGDVDAEAVGLLTVTDGVTMATGMIARHRQAPQVKFLLDYEGPADRHQTSTDSGGHIPVPVDSEAFWVQREAARFIKQLPSIYLRMQTAQDGHSGGLGNTHCIALIDSATHTTFGGSGKAAWTRVNDSVMNEPNRTYTLGNPPRYIPEAHEVQNGFRYLVYLHELAGMRIQSGQSGQRPPAVLATVRLDANPVRLGTRVRVSAPGCGGRLGIWSSDGRLVATSEGDADGRFSWDGTSAGRFVPAGCYWVQPIQAGASGVKLVLTP